MKLVKKNKLWFNKGHFFKGDKMVNIDPVVVAQLNQLEIVVQQYRYIQEQPEACPEPSLDGWEFKSANDKKLHMEVDTPTLDKLVEQAKALMDDIDHKDQAREMNEAFERYAELIQWCDETKILVGYVSRGERVDTKFLGNPLDLTAQDIADIIVDIVTGGEVTRDV